MIKTFAIETSCDDTSAGIICFDGDKFFVENILAYSQIVDHNVYGGVVPELASRLHSEKIVELISKFGKDFHDNIDFVSVTSTPGLPGSLLVGKTAAYMIGEFFSKQVVGVNHIHGHIFSLLLDRNLNQINFPMIVLTASGGHNDIYLIDKSSSDNQLGCIFDIIKIGTTLDDAAGECFDKVSRMLGGPYPGGARISQRAALGGPNQSVKIGRIFLKSDEFNFSFSGMKSKMYYLLQDLREKGIEISDGLVNDICFEFQSAVVEMLSNKIIKAALKFDVKTIGITGGVSANDYLFEYVQDQVHKKNLKLDIIRPTNKLYSTDNGAMIGVVGILNTFKAIK